jgi:hypothetical protein
MITSLIKPFEPKFWELKTEVLESRRSVLVSGVVGLEWNPLSETGKTIFEMFSTNWPGSVNPVPMPISLSGRVESVERESKMTNS